MTECECIKKFFILFFSLSIFLYFSNICYGIPASPGTHELTQSDGITKFLAKQWGDEYQHGWETVEGYTIIFDEATKNWEYAAQDDSGNLISSGSVVAVDHLPLDVLPYLRPAPALKKAPGQSSPGEPDTVPQKAIPTKGTGKIPVILINFSNTTTKYGTSDFDTLLFGTSNKSMKKYYEEVSYGQFTITGGSAGVKGWYTASNTHDYYGQNDANGNDKYPRELVREAVQAADTTVNFADYDSDGDCYCDNVVLVYQGTGEADSGINNDIWPHQWEIPVYTTNDLASCGYIKVKKYTVQPELVASDKLIQTIGVFAHEYGHALGLPDLYDTDDSSNGLGYWCLMASGGYNKVSRAGDTPPHLCPWAKYFLKWITPTQVSWTNTKVIKPAYSTADVYQILSGNPADGGEYFLIENRYKSGFDQGLPGNGIAIWHIDESKKTSNNEDNRYECYPPNNCAYSHYRVSLEQADGNWHLEKNYNNGQSNDLYTQGYSFSDSTTPNSKKYNGASSNGSVDSIQRQGEDISASLSDGTPVTTTTSSTTSSTTTSTTTAQSTSTSSSSMITTTAESTTSSSTSSTSSSTTTGLPSSYTLDVSLFGAGSGTVTSKPSGIVCGSDCSESYGSGTEVTLTAEARSGSYFKEWSGACSGTGKCIVTMNKDSSVNAFFEKKKPNSDFNGNGNADILWRNKTTGKISIWLMNGTAKDSEGSPGIIDDFNWEIINTGDFNGNGNADILWRNKTTGKISIWLMNGTAKDSEGSPGTIEDTNWKIAGGGDFNGDGRSDILWKNKSTGQVFIWLMNGVAKDSEGSPGTVEDLNWEINDTGDFNGDGKSDILWRNKTTGQVYIWFMNDLTLNSEGSPGTVDDMKWEIKNVGDFNRDWKSDILWRNKITGQVYIWIMNGVNRDSEGSPGTVDDLNWIILNAEDYNGDGKSDILWRNKTTGQTYIWIMNGVNRDSEGSPGTVDNLDWEISTRPTDKAENTVTQVISDFNGNGKSDILWRNKTTGQTYIWLMNSMSKDSQDSPGTVEDLNWEIKGIGDFNGNGKSDVLWRNKTTGQIHMWLMNGTSKDSEGRSETVEDLNWEIKGIGDFNGNGKSDILWRNKNNGMSYIWLMNQTTKESDGSPGNVDDLNWEIKGVGDFNGNGKSDILWRNKNSGQVFIWLINGVTKESDGSPGRVEDLNWEIIDTGDFNGDGKSDILWRNKTTGTTYIWIMNGIAINSKDSPGTVEDLNWEIISAQDFDGNGKSDILWRNKNSGQVFMWLMNGITRESEGTVDTVSNLNWEIKKISGRD